jgi:hypothetical protein
MDVRNEVKKRRRDEMEAGKGFCPNQECGSNTKNWDRKIMLGT